MSVRVGAFAALSIGLVAAAVFWAIREEPRSREVYLLQDPTSPRPGGEGTEVPPTVPVQGGAVVTEGATEPAKERERLKAELRSELKAELRAELLAELKKAVEDPKALAAAPALESPESMATDQLLARLEKAARTPEPLRKEPLDAAASLKDAEALLARNLAAEDRVKVLIDKAILHRVKPADPVLEEQMLREAAALQGEDTKGGREVLFQLAWTRSRRGDDREAMDLFDRVASHADTEPGFRTTNRWEAAVRADRQGDKERARQWYRAYIDEVGSAEGDWFRRNVARAKERLKELE